VAGAVRRGHSGAIALGGWALDGGISRRLPVPFRPVLTVGYARASGDRSSEDRADHTFRQTGLEDNEGRFDGAKVFAYYGSVLQPELSNLEILTAAVSLNARRRSSLDLVYHRYRQVIARPGTTATALRWRTSGSARHLGDELDAIVSFRLGPTVDFNITAGILHAGSASTSHATVFEWRPQIKIYF
jgi:alginate production protein